MPIGIEVYSDYVCPYCSLMEVAITEASRDLNVEIKWKPFELRPFPTKTLRPEDDYLPRVWEKSVYPLAKALNVPLRLPSISPQPYSRLAHEGYRQAQRAGRADAYHRRVFEAFFNEDRDIGDIDVLARLAGEVGMAEDTFRVALESGEFTDTHKLALREAADLGVHSVPCVFIDGQPVRSVYEPDELRLILLKKASGEVSVASRT